MGVCGRGRGGGGLVPYIRIQPALKPLMYFVGIAVCIVQDLPKFQVGMFSMCKVRVSRRT